MRTQLLIKKIKLWPLSQVHGHKPVPKLGTTFGGHRLMNRATIMLALSYNFQRTSFF